MPYILSPEQDVVTRAIVEKDSSITKYLDRNTALEAVIVAINKIIDKEKTVLLHIPEHLLPVIKDEWVKTSLEGLTIQIDQTTPISELDALKLRSASKQDPAYDDLLAYEGSKLKSKKFKNEVLKYYEALQQNVSPGIALSKYLNAYVYAKTPSHTIDIPLISNGHRLSLEKIQSYKNAISIAAQMYDSQFELLDRLDLLDDNVWKNQNDDAITKMKSDVALLYQEAKILHGDYKQLYQQLIEVRINETNKAFKDLQVLLESYDEKVTIAHIMKSHAKVDNPSLLSIFGKRKPIDNDINIQAFDAITGKIKVISNEWYNELPSPTSDQITYEYIHNFIQSCLENLTIYHLKAKDGAKHVLLSINRINDPSGQVNTLDHRLNALISKMTTTGYFVKDFSQNILNFIKQEVHCGLIVKYLDACNIIINGDNNYQAYRHFIVSQDPLISQAIDLLKGHEKHTWVETFTLWYQELMVKSLLYKSSPDASVMTEYHACISTNLKTWPKAIEIRHHAKRSDSINALKASNKDLYNSLFKKKQMSSESWDSIALMNRAFLQNIFPIHITTRLAYLDHYDVVISLDEKVGDFSDKAIHRILPLSKEDIGNTDLHINRLYLNKYDYQGQINQLPNAEQLKAAKKIAKMILSLNQDVKLYHTKYANIISLLPHQDDQQLEMIMEDTGIKYLDTHDSPYDRLTESILLYGRNQYLLIKDQLLNRDLTSCIEWQILVRHLIEDAGITVVSIDTIDQVEDATKVLLDLKSILHNHTKTVISTPSSITNTID